MKTVGLLMGLCKATVITRFVWSQVRFYEPVWHRLCLPVSLQGREAARGASDAGRMPAPPWDGLPGRHSLSPNLPRSRKSRAGRAPCHSGAGNHARGGRPAKGRENQREKSGGRFQRPPARSLPPRLPSTTTEGGGCGLMVDGWQFADNAGDADTINPQPSTLNRKTPLSRLTLKLGICSARRLFLGRRIAPCFS